MNKLHKTLFRQFLLLGILLAIPLVPFLLFHARIDRAVEKWVQQPRATPVIAGTIIGLLATDFLLPIPSSVLSTFGGGKLGWFMGTVASWLGMTAGACLGFALARYGGQGWAARLSDPKQLEQFADLAERYGPTAIVLCRGIPLYAEVSVLWMGMHGMRWRRFLLPMALSNLGIALGYSAFGQIAAAYQLLPVALGVSLALPVLLAMFLGRNRVRTGG